jgi:hypothetical protein
MSNTPLKPNATPRIMPSFLLWPLYEIYVYIHFTHFKVSLFPGYFGDCHFISLLVGTIPMHVLLQSLPDPWSPTRYVC